jgi:hypothetical protein
MILKVMRRLGENLLAGPFGAKFTGAKRRSLVSKPEEAAALKNNIVFTTSFAETLVKQLNEPGIKAADVEVNLI